MADDHDAPTTSGGTRTAAAAAASGAAAYPHPAADQAAGRAEGLAASAAILDRLEPEPRDTATTTLRSCRRR